jgi:hypothetical protein
MNILHGDFRFFGDNQTGNLAATVFATATRARSDSGPGGTPVFRHGAKIKSLLRAGADLLTRRVFGLDFDGCRALGRYLVARASARLSSFPVSFVFSPGSPDLSVSLRRLKTNLAPSLPPEEGRGRSFSPGIVQDEFPAPINAGVCR